ncbi:MAG: hypothetical protein ACFHU9_18075 [Fluviicola sp.]
MRVLFYILLLFFLVGCQEKSHTVSSTTKTVISSNPIDKIKGEKYISASGKVRAHNFDLLLGLKRQDLENPAALYNLEKLSESFYIMQQKKHYSEARTFLALLKVDKDEVIDYTILNDVRIEGAVMDASGIKLLTGNIENHNEYWKQENFVALYSFDFDLNLEQTYRVSSEEYPMRATRLQSTKDGTKVGIEVITGCGICVNYVTLTFNRKLECVSAKHSGKSNTSVVLSDDFIERTFLQGKKL